MTLLLDALLLISVCVIFFILFFKLGQTKLSNKITGSVLIGLSLDMAIPPYPTTDLPFFIIYLTQKNLLNFNTIFENLFNTTFYGQFIDVLIQKGLYAEYILFVIIISFTLTLLGIAIGGIPINTLIKSFAKDIKGRLSLFAILFGTFIFIITLAKITNYYHINGNIQFDKEFFIIAITLSIFASSIVLLILLLLEQIFNIKTEKIIRMVGM